MRLALLMAAALALGACVPVQPVYVMPANDYGYSAPAAPIYIQARPQPMPMAPLHPGDFVEPGMMPLP